MVCDKCKRHIPDDSVFCHFCGYNLNTASVSAIKEHDSVQVHDDELKSVDGNVKRIVNEEDATSENFAGIWLKMQAEETIRAASANEKDQPNNEEEKDFGLIPEKPIFTLATDSVAGEHVYLNKLYTLDGRKIKWIRLGSTSVDSIHGMIDIYNIYLESGDFYKTIYINMYGARESTSAPAGFTFNCNMDRTPGQSIETCENVHDTQIDDNSLKKIDEKKEKTGRIVKKLTGICIDKRKFFFGYGTIIIVLFALLAMLFINNLALKKENLQMTETIAANNEYIVELEENIDEWISDRDSMVEERDYWQTEAKIARDELSVVEYEMRFYDDHAVVVSDDGTNLYHRYGCAYLDISSFWIYNLEAAVAAGYVPCSNCN